MHRHSLILAGCFLGLILLSTSCGPDSGGRAVSGTIDTDEVRVGSRYGGRVTALFADEGEALKPGQLIARLDAPELRARRDRQAAQLTEFVAGPRPQEIEAARQEWESVNANLALARADAGRAEDLFAHKTISVTERDQAATRAEALERDAAAAKSRLDLLLAGTRPEQIAQARAQLAETDALLAETNVVAPADSVLEVLSVKAGDVLAANQEVATLLLPRHLWVRVYVPETWLGRVKPGGAARIRVDAYPGKEYAGVVEVVNREAEFTPRNVQTVGERVRQVFGVKVRLDNSSGELRAGMSADVMFPTESK